MIFSMIATFFLVTYLQKVIKKTKSLIIKADELHYRTDLITNGSVLLSLVVIKITGLFIIDAIVSIAISGYIIKSAFDILLE
jgi:divalent metal cation (Fe/Co/Zn/Cd) transporter